MAGSSVKKNKFIKFMPRVVFSHNNKTFCDLQVANSPSKLRFEANLSREDSQSTEYSQKPEMISYRDDSLSRKSLIK